MQYNASKRKEIYTQLKEQQGARCAICGIEEKDLSQSNTYRKSSNLVIDHDHKTGEVRGLLCQACNIILGSSGDNPEILQHALDYLDVGIANRPKISLR